MSELRKKILAGLSFGTPSAKITTEIMNEFYELETERDHLLKENEALKHLVEQTKTEAYKQVCEKSEIKQLREGVRELEEEVDEWEQMASLNADQAEKNAGYKTAHDIHMIVCDFEHIKRKSQLTKMEEALEDIIKDRPWMDTTDLVDEIFSIAKTALAKIRGKQVG